MISFPKDALVEIIIFSPNKKEFTNTYAKNLQKSYKDIILVAGRYEGIDERVGSQVLEHAPTMDEMSEHRVHQLVTDETEEVFRPTYVRFCKLRVVVKDSIGRDASRRTVLARFHGLDEGRDEAVMTERVAQRFAYGLQSDSHGYVSPLETLEMRDGPSRRQVKTWCQWTLNTTFPVPARKQ